jgi:hypothetical protein
MIGTLWKGVLPALTGDTVAGLGRLLFSKSWGRFEEAVKDPAAAQQARLSAILSANADTEFGRLHGFGRIKTPSDYRAAVPVRDWAGFEPFIAKMVEGEKNVLTSENVLFFARSSGTTGNPKHVPVTESFLQEYRTGRRVWMRQVLQTFPGLVRGTLLTIHSPRIEYRTPAGVPCGSITIPLGMNNLGLSVAKGFHDIPMEIFHIADFDAKYYCILRFALQSDISMIGAINPSTVMLFCKKLAEFAPRLARDLRDGGLEPGECIDPILKARLKRKLSPAPEMAAALEGSLSKNGFVKPAEVWPGLCGLLSWKGGSAPFYLRQFPKWFGDLPVMDYGYGATEGNFSIAMSAEGDDGVLIPNGHYMEFIPEDCSTESTPAVGMEALVPGGRYRVIITASNGLCRYDINDIVECTGMYARTPRVRFIHKGGSMLSITGEKVGEAHVVEAVTAACAECGIEPVGFTATIRLAETPYYLLGIEVSHGFNEGGLVHLGEVFDRALRRVNMEYDAKRESLRLERPAVLLLEAGVYAGYREAQVKAGAPDAHCKPPHLSPDEGIFERLKVVREVGAHRDAPGQVRRRT